MKVTSRKEWDGNVEHTFERDSFQFAIPTITNKEWFVLLIKPETLGCIKPSSIPVAIGISCICWSSQSGYLPFDNMIWTLWHQNQQHIHIQHKTDITISRVIIGQAHTLESHLLNWTLIGNVYGIVLLINCNAIRIIQTSTRSRSIPTRWFAAPSMNTHQSWDNKSEEEEEERRRKKEERRKKKRRKRLVCYLMLWSCKLSANQNLLRRRCLFCSAWLFPLGKTTILCVQACWPVLIIHSSVNVMKGDEKIRWNYLAMWSFWRHCWDCHKRTSTCREGSSICLVDVWTLPDLHHRPQSL